MYVETGKSGIYLRPDNYTGDGLSTHVVVAHTNAMYTFVHRFDQGEYPNLIDWSKVDQISSLL